MPILSGFLSTMFGGLFAFFAARFSIGIAAAAAFVSVSLAAFIAVKAALAALMLGLTAVPAGLAAAFVVAGYFMPSNLAECLTAILIADAVSTSWDYWRSTLGIAVQLAKG